MIYEAAILSKAEITDDKVQVLKTLVGQVIQEFEGEILLADDWGVRTFPRSIERGKSKGRYLYFMYKGKTGVNLELERKLKISEDVVRSLIVKMGEDRFEADYVKTYVFPFKR
jgi:ribosomal protein S6